MATETIITTKDLHKQFQMGEVIVHALAGVDLTVNKGDMVVLFGPSGSGKTTLLNMLGGIDTPTKGQVSVAGVPVAGMDEGGLTAFRRDKVGWIFQFFNLVPSLTALENVALSLELAGLNESMEDNAREALELVGLPGLEDRFPSQLSGGQQQRVAIARAIVKKPEVMLCDEPTGNLDSETGAEIVEVMKNLNENEGITFVIVTHDKSLTKMADLVLKMKDGLVTELSQNSAKGAVE